ncbi:hypothetical protein ACETK8_16985 [Brevundimonas staleyi]|uniref:EF-hand domain-containing protein n=1 Tax=Brevundimonas staleyi TaxID=74326 RepID=A0ABW0FWP5_9CAUL
MSIIAVALLAALNGAAPQDRAAPRVESRSEIRIVTADGEGPGRLDADGDGEVTREEFTAPMNNAFDRLDKNGDGKLSAEELAAGPGPGGPGRRVMMFGGPGGPGGPGEHDVRIITRDGGPGGPGMPMIFHGGGEGGPVQIFTSRIGPDGGPPSGGPGGHQIFVRRFGPNGSVDMDKNGDGKVSQEEFLAPMIEAFQRMDADNDGFLDEGEGRPTPPPAD